jgi:hypothetical protein
MVAMCGDGGVLVEVVILRGDCGVVLVSRGWVVVVLVAEQFVDESFIRGCLVLFR